MKTVKDKVYSEQDMIDMIQIIKVKQQEINILYAEVAKLKKELGIDRILNLKEK